MKNSIAIVKKQALILLSYLLMFYVLTSSADSQPKLVAQSISSQIGFYDILAQKQEIYELNVQATSVNNYDIQLIMAKDPRFLLQGKITFSEPQNNYLNAELIPVRYYNPLPNLMINSFVDYATHHNFVIKDITTTYNRHLFISRSGMLILLPNVVTTTLVNNEKRDKQE